MSNAPYTPEPMQPQIPRPSGSGGTWAIVVAVIIVGLFAVVICGGLLVGLTLPAVQAAREAARRMQCQNNMKQIALALFNYESVHKSFPPAYTVDENGTPLHSWRTLILPYMEQKALYDSIDLSKPWDDPVNIRYSEIDLMFYRCPSTPLSAGMTTYVAINDPAGVFADDQPSKIATIVDGTSNTILFTETDMANAVNWMSPQDIDLSTFVSGANQYAHAGGHNCAISDGSVIFISENTQPQVLEAMVTKNGGESIPVQP